jgi:hypothetical protein
LRKLKIKYIGLALVAAVSIYSYINPAFAVCALSDAAWSKHEFGAHSEEAGLMDSARSRIANTFGQPRATPKVIFWDADSILARLKLNAYGSTQFIGTRACVIIGPKGRSVDVLAHEMLHAEIFDRIGFWKRMSDFPVWFDEGVAMQVDYRSDYDFPSTDDSMFIRQLDKPSEFFVSNSEVLTRNYAGAKAEVGKWLDRNGATKLYHVLEQLRSGHAFESLIN